MIEKLDLSIIIPAKNEAKSVLELSHRISSTVEAEQLTYEVICIDDGSTDGTWEEIVKVNKVIPSFKCC